MLVGDVCMQTGMQFMTGYEFVISFQEFFVALPTPYKWPGLEQFCLICNWQVISRKITLIKNALQGPFISTKGRSVVTNSTQVHPYNIRF